jgi:hypothetical protein
MTVSMEAPRSGQAVFKFQKPSCVSGAPCTYSVLSNINHHNPYFTITPRCALPCTTHAQKESQWDGEACDACIHADASRAYIVLSDTFQNGMQMQKPYRNKNRRWRLRRSWLRRWPFEIFLRQLWEYTGRSPCVYDMCQLRKWSLSSSRPMSMKQS